MTCARCHGLVVQESSSAWVHYHCLSCGDRFDSVVMTHRYQTRPPAWAVAERILAELDRLSTP